ncbi:hypothetical protein OIU84_029545 [Salix udensis]|uniref:Uncharacterized protein n=1 Tax=Salix udensis TaxID=889485 RepID=A0AAD6P8E1_9ROSI|nr:hypothetical protein OIU84_029545 [Salix udensis]
MEERVPTEGGDSSDEPPPHPRPPPPDHDQILKPSRCFSSRNKSIKHPSPPPTESETYIVQIPKDQIFSIPPTENAAIAERHRLPQKKEQSEGDATLEYKNHKIGTGKFPKLDHDADSLTNFKLDLKGTKGSIA